MRRFHISIQKKIVSMLFAICISLGLLGIRASAGTIFEERSVAPEKNNKYYFSEINPFYPNLAPDPGFIDSKGNCTWYAYGRAYELLDSKPLLSTAWASNWYNDNKENNWYEYSDSIPKLGAVACWSNHVAIVEKINDDGTINISESSYVQNAGIYWQLREKLSSSSPDNGGDSFYGYIYLPLKEDQIITGKCGTNVNYSYSEATKTLTISGSGKMSGNGLDALMSDVERNIEKVVIEKGVTSIDEYAFNGYINLTSVIIPDSVTEIGQEAFGYCSSLTSIIIPNSVTEIKYEAFQKCGLTSITIPSSVKKIYDWAFDKCSSLNSVIIEKGVASIGYGAFHECTNLTSVTIPDSVTEIDQYAFFDSGLTSITIPGSVKEIESHVIASCDNLKSVNILNGVTEISSSAIINNSSLTSVTIPNSVTSINSWAICSNSSLTSLTISDSVISISTHAFDNNNEGFFLVGNSNSYVESYAKENNYCFTTPRWESVEANIENLENVCCTIDMDGKIAIPQNILEIAKEKNLDLDLEFDNYTWTIKSTDITDPRSIRLEVKKVNYISAEKLSSLSGNLDQIQIMHSGDFGFSATLKYFVGKQYSGKRIGLYYYDESNPFNNFKLTQRVTVDKDGYARFAFNHASYYVLNIENGDELPYSSENNSEENNFTNDNSESTQKSTEEVFFELIYSSIDDALKKGENIIRIDGRASGVNSLNLKTLQYAKEKGISLEFIYTYKGKEYDVLIPASKIIIDNKIPWYGPLYLYANYSANGNSKTEQIEHIYIVKSGDTLGKIAKINGIDMSKLKELNTNLFKQKYIHIGQKVVLQSYQD